MTTWGYEPGVLILATCFMTMAVLGMDLLETGWIKPEVGLDEEDGSTRLDKVVDTPSWLDGEEASPRMGGDVDNSIRMGRVGTTRSKLIFLKTQHYNNRYFVIIMLF
jgi:hypothetical protein